MDKLILELADYAISPLTPSEKILDQAWLCLYDAIGCAMAALEHAECRKILGPLAPECSLTTGAKVPGIGITLDPVQAAFNLGSMIRWLDYNDTFLAKEWTHPSDNLGGIIILLDYLFRAQGKRFHIRELLIALIKAYEIQGVLALENSFNQIGLDHVILVKIATAAIATALLGGTKAQTYTAISQAFVDMGPLRTYRHSPNTTSRKSWAAGDATSRGVQLAFLTMKGEQGCLTPLSAPKWGLEALFFKDKKLTLTQSLGTYIVENILFKVGFPAEFHAQTAIEAALLLHQEFKPLLFEIERIEIQTHAAALKIIDKQGLLKNYADRDHCMQYMVAVALLYGNLTPHSYSDAFAKQPEIDLLRQKITLSENRRFSQDYLDPNLRSIASSLTIIMKDGRQLQKTLEYPLGHKRRRAEARPLLHKKFEQNIKILSLEKQQRLIKDFFQIEQFDELMHLIT